MPLDGTLSDLALPSLIQLQCSEQRNVQVRLVHREREGILTFAAGELIHAQVGALAGDDAVYELLTWEDGAFHVREGIGDLPARNVHTPWSALVLEGLRRADEARAERNAALEAALRDAREQRRVREALVVSPNGVVRADATAGDSARRAALIAFIVQRALAVGATMQVGSCERFLGAFQNQKVWIERLEDDYLACWLEGRTTPESLKDLMQSLQAIASGKSR